MECKEVFVPWSSAKVFGINRNIVECKVQKKTLLPMMSAVLIETLWNVKIAKVYQIDEKSRINRNIVECKECHIVRCSRALSY